MDAMTAQRWRFRRYDSAVHAFRGFC
ncbi:Anther-specific proline-rich protein APG [Zea mays]|uniref:Anther-specific proline-rich protein APG n=1 Tax=Zea mays TaxID=4577 RepID=A0A1D6KUQ0_MAIZE|nr:Anther-specific proline-rich protein APG [Zea mays]